MKNLNDVNELLLEIARTPNTDIDIKGDFPLIEDIIMNLTNTRLELVRQSTIIVNEATTLMIQEPDSLEIEGMFNKSYSLLQESKSLDFKIKNQNQRLELLRAESWYINLM